VGQILRKPLWPIAPASKRIWAGRHSAVRLSGAIDSVKIERMGN
jgi:hypothetical protein